MISSTGSGPTSPARTWTSSPGPTTTARSARGADAQERRSLLLPPRERGRHHHRAASSTPPASAPALLHDVVEDTLATTTDIEREFGQEVAFLVDGVTKLSKINFASKEDRQAENFRKMLVAMARDIRVLLVKLCDRLDNMRTLEHMKPEAQERIARETMEIYAPLANRLGIARFKSELEDLSFRYIEPEAYADLEKQIQTTKAERDKYIAEVCKTLAASSPSRASPPTSPAARSTSTRSGARCRRSSATSIRSTTSSRSA